MKDLINTILSLYQSFTRVLSYEKYIIPIPQLYHGTPVLEGELIFEIDGVDEATAIKALELGKYKLPFKTKIVKRF